jgi:hypothetical protein
MMTRHGAAAAQPVSLIFESRLEKSTRVAFAKKRKKRPARHLNPGFFFALGKPKCINPTAPRIAQFK